MANENSVELLGYYGSDLTIAQSAWTSTNRELSQDKLDRIPKLLKMLATDGHHTPFEKTSLHFLIQTDIATHIQICKHRIGVSLNAESARYKELKEDNFLLPSDWKGVSSSDELHSLYGNDWYEILESYSKLGNDLYHKCLEDLTPKLGRKRAKESARYFKGYNSQITADVMFNFRSFVHFLHLRNKPEAQKEIRDVASRMLELVKNIDGNPFEQTILAFNL
jgi:thymidylate synthase (FAD)